ncbi:hypothetical protein Tco_0059471 [Tanacetum coccineum]
MSVRPKDVERVSSVVEGRVPSKTGTAQMQSPEVDSATQLDECLSFYGLLRFIHCGNLVDVVPCFVALCLPVVVMEILDGFLYLLLENHVILSLFRVCALICFLLVNLMIPWFSELYSDMVVIGESYDSLKLEAKLELGAADTKSDVTLGFGNTRSAISFGTMQWNLESLSQWFNLRVTLLSLSLEE